MPFTSIEICAGGGGQALGLEQAGFLHTVLVEIEPVACKTLRANRPLWNVIEGSVLEFSAKNYKNVDLLAGGVPCPPFSIAGKQLGGNDERDLFPEAMRLVRECDPKAILLENVRGLLSKKFEEYRKGIILQLNSLGYMCEWHLVNASDFGLPQTRSRAILIAIKPEYYNSFKFPIGNDSNILTVGELLYEEMKSAGWDKVDEWKQQANKIAPTLVGGSKKHGGPDLGPTRARKLWAELGVDGLGIANTPPQKDHIDMPRLTLAMTALLQGFPKDWIFEGKKTAAYRQIGNAFPPPVAKAIGSAILKALKTKSQPIQHEGRRLKSKVA